LLLLDNSAWARLSSEHLTKERAEEIAVWMSEHRLATCLPFLLEAGYSARSGGERTEMMSNLARLPRVEIDKEIEGAAIEAQRELAEVGHHRLAPTDLVIAACADGAGVGVLHYDRDYDVIAERTNLAFESEWLAPPGKL
jgi:predicted nucleic acid-binding protein